jgi:hypothetical protein
MLQKTGLTTREQLPSANSTEDLNRTTGSNLAVALAEEFAHA